MADITVVEGEAADTVYVELFSDAGLPITPASSCTLQVWVDDYIHTIDCALFGTNRVSFIPTEDMVAAPGEFRARFHVDATTYYPSNRNPFTILVRPHVRSR